MCFTGLCCSAAPASLLALHANNRAPLRLVTVFLYRAVLPEFAIIDLQHRCSFHKHPLCAFHIAPHIALLSIAMVVLPLHDTFFTGTCAAPLVRSCAKLLLNKQHFAKQTGCCWKSRRSTSPFTDCAFLAIDTLLKRHAAGYVHSWLCSYRCCCQMVYAY